MLVHGFRDSLLIQSTWSFTGISWGGDLGKGAPFQVLLTAELTRGLVSNFLIASNTGCLNSLGIDSGMSNQFLLYSYDPSSRGGSRQLGPVLSSFVNLN